MNKVLLLVVMLARGIAGAQDPNFIPCQPFGGQRAVDDLFERELRFPDDAMAEGIEGVSTLIFIVGADGTVRDLRVWEPLSPSCDEEAVRLARMVRWHAARLGGEARDAEHYLKVPFDPKQYRKWLKARSTACPALTDMPSDGSGGIHERGEVDSLPAPRIKGGMKGLPAYLTENLRYPPDAFRRDLQGVVRLEFVVEPSGSLSNMRAIDELGGGCTEEAMRLVRGLCWRPAVKDARRVRCTQEVSLAFRIVASPNDRY